MSMEKIPEEIKKQIEEKAKEQGSGFVVTTFTNGAEFGYSLASKEIDILKGKLETRHIKINGNKKLKKSA